jgi:hypothetical protein
MLGLARGDGNNRGAVWWFGVLGVVVALVGRMNTYRSIPKLVWVPKSDTTGSVTQTYGTEEASPRGWWEDQGNRAERRKVAKMLKKRKID